jgi:hypothetical protein
MLRLNRFSDFLQIRNEKFHFSWRDSSSGARKIEEG